MQKKIEKYLFAFKNCFAFEKKNKKKLEQKSFVSSPKKNDSHTISIYGNCMISFLFQNMKTSDFYHQIVLLESNIRRN